MQISADHETLFINYHVRIHVDLSSTIISLGPWAFTFWCGVNLDNLNLECNGHKPSVSCVK